MRSYLDFTMHFIPLMRLKLQLDFLPFYTTTAENCRKPQIYREDRKGTALTASKT